MKLPETLIHLLSDVLDAASDYYEAEQALSQAQHEGIWAQEAATAKRKAAILAVAIDGLSDRASRELGIRIERVRSSVSALCILPGTQTVRPSAFERVNSVANAYKHFVLSKQSHVISSYDDVLVVASGYGSDGYGVGKFGGVEVLVREKSGERWKFLGDVPAVINGWIHFLQGKGVALPSDPIEVCGLRVHPQSVADRGADNVTDDVTIRPQSTVTEPHRSNGGNSEVP